MKHYSLLIALILLTGCLLSSCSTTNEARRFSHLDYVKTNKKYHFQESTALAQKEIKPLAKKQASPIPAPNNDYAASADKSVNPKDIVKEQINSNANVLKSFSPWGISSAIQKKDVKKLTEDAKSILNENNISKSSYSGSLMDDPGKLLMLWLILAGASIVFSIIYVATVSTIFWVLAVIAGIAATVFFIMWIVALAKS